jgi:hypothetical protein
MLGSAIGTSGCCAPICGGKPLQVCSRTIP